MRQFNHFSKTAVSTLLILAGFQLFGPGCGGGGGDGGDGDTITISGNVKSAALVSTGEDAGLRKSMRSAVTTEGAANEEVACQDQDANDCGTATTNEEGDYEIEIDQDVTHVVMTTESGYSAVTDVDTSSEDVTVDVNPNTTWPAELFAAATQSGDVGDVIVADYEGDPDCFRGMASALVDNASDAATDTVGETLGYGMDIVLSLDALNEMPVPEIIETFVLETPSDETIVEKCAVVAEAGEVTEEACLEHAANVAAIAAGLADTFSTVAMSSDDVAEQVEGLEEGLCAQVLASSDQMLVLGQIVGAIPDVDTLSTTFGSEATEEVLAGALALVQGSLGQLSTITTALVEGGSIEEGGGQPALPAIGQFIAGYVVGKVQAGTLNPNDVVTDVTNCVAGAGAMPITTPDSDDFVHPVQLGSGVAQIADAGVTIADNAGAVLGYVVFATQEAGTTSAPNALTNVGSGYNVAAQDANTLTTLQTCATTPGGCAGATAGNTTLASSSNYIGIQTPTDGGTITSASPTSCPDTKANEASCNAGCECSSTFCRMSDMVCADNPATATTAGTGTGTTTGTTGTTGTTAAATTYALTVSCSGTGSGTVSSAPAGVNCTCTAGVSSGTCAQTTSGVVTLTGTATSDSTLSYSGACTGTTCAPPVNAETSVTATFTANSLPTFSGPYTGSSVAGGNATLIVQTFTAAGGNTSTSASYTTSDNVTIALTIGTMQSTTGTCTATQTGMLTCASCSYNHSGSGGTISSITYTCAVITYSLQK